MMMMTLQCQAMVKSSIKAILFSTSLMNEYLFATPPPLKTQNEEDITNTELQSVGGENLLRKSVVDSLQGEVKILAMIAIFLCITPPP